MSSLWIVVDLYQRIFTWGRRKLIVRPALHSVILIAVLVLVLEGLPHLLAPIIPSGVTFLILCLILSPFVLMTLFHYWRYWFK
ncbi:MAG: hypothetical protein Kow00114_33110 [Kiloniellaceae bacterium]